MDWLVKVDGEVLLNTEDLTFDEQEALEQVTGISWYHLLPLSDAKSARALLALALVKSGMDDEAAKDKVSQMTRREYRDSFEAITPEAGNDDRPKEWEDGLPLAGAQATSGSSGPTDSLTGLPT